MRHQRSPKPTRRLSGRPFLHSDAWGKHPRKPLLSPALPRDLSAASMPANSAGIAMFAVELGSSAASESTVGSPCVEPQGRRKILIVDIPGSVRIPLLQDARNVSPHDVESRSVCPKPVTSVTVVRGSVFDQATRMLLLAMVRAACRTRSSDRATWMQKMAIGLRGLSL
jgi:hypothetical protein